VLQIVSSGMILSTPLCSSRSTPSRQRSPHYKPTRWG